jgi:hypothetical protein
MGNGLRYQPRLVTKGYLVRHITDTLSQKPSGNQNLLENPLFYSKVYFFYHVTGHFRNVRPM